VDLELELMRGRYRADFAAAFVGVLSGLPEEERALLREHFLEGQGIDQLALKYRIHRSTAARKVARIRQRLLDGTRQALADRLQLSAGSLQSLMVALRSNFEVSLGRFLQPKGG
jgi:RNA polymerase sigma-70 factor (ECF subfamily)